MSKTEKLNEEQVFKQEISDDELEAVAGGDDEIGKNCDEIWVRDIYYGGFPNCAATVEDGSWCMSNDACQTASVAYVNRTECEIAWR